MTSPNSFDGEWVWLTHPDLGDSPNPVLREAAKFFERVGWTQTEAPKPPPLPGEATDADYQVPADTSPDEPTTPSRRRAPATPDAASGPAAPDENKE